MVSRTDHTGLRRIPKSVRGCVSSFLVGTDYKLHIDSYGAFQLLYILLKKMHKMSHVKSIPGPRF